MADEIINDRTEFFNGQYEVGSQFTFSLAIAVFGLGFTRKML